MAIQRCQITATFEYLKSGVLVPVPTGTPVTVTNRSTGNPAIVYSGMTGSGTLAQPIPSDSGGNVPGYVSQGSYTITAAPVPLATPPFQGASINFEAVRGDGVENYAAGSVTSAALAPGVGGGLPTGVILDFAGTNAPAGFLLCDGASKPTTGDTAALFAVIQYTYGGTGANFNVPDLRSRGTVGSGPGTQLTNHALGAKFGEESHVLTGVEMPVHGHGVSDPTHGHGVNDPTHAHNVYDPGHGHSQFNRIDIGTPSVAGVPVTWNAMRGWYQQPYLGDPFPALTGIGIYGAGTGITIGGSLTGIAILNAGGGGGHNNLPPSVAVNKIIKM